VSAFTAGSVRHFPLPQSTRREESLAFPRRHVSSFPAVRHEERGGGEGSWFLDANYPLAAAASLGIRRQEWEWDGN
jgi:hypothetical protein